MNGHDIFCKSGNRYVVDIFPLEIMLYWQRDMQTLLYIGLEDEDGEQFPSGVTGFEAFGVAAREFKVMTGLLDDMLGKVRSRASGLIVPDSICYDGTGVELGAQFGFMTSGYRMNLSGMDISLKPVKVMCDIDCNVTICCEMDYKRHGRDDTRNVRLGSGKGFDEALANAERRLSGMTADVAELEMWLYDRLCVRNGNEVAG